MSHPVTDNLGIAATAIASTVLAWFGVINPSEQMIWWFSTSAAVGAGTLLVATASCYATHWERLWTTVRSVIMGIFLGSGILLVIPDPYSGKLGVAIIIVALSVYFSAPLYKAARSGALWRWVLAFRTGELFPEPPTEDKHPGRRRGDL